jgi:hypothetical protein
LVNTSAAEGVIADSVEAVGEVPAAPVPATLDIVEDGLEGTLAGSAGSTEGDRSPAAGWCVEASTVVGAAAPVARPSDLLSPSAA